MNNPFMDLSLHNALLWLLASWCMHPASAWSRTFGPAGNSQLAVHDFLCLRRDSDAQPGCGWWTACIEEFGGRMAARLAARSRSLNYNKGNKMNATSTGMAVAATTSVDVNSADVHNYNSHVPLSAAVNPAAAHRKGANGYMESRWHNGPKTPAEDLDLALRELGIDLEQVLKAAIPEAGWTPSKGMVNSAKRAFRADLEQLAMAKLIEAGQQLHDALVKAADSLLRWNGRKPGPVLQNLPTEALYKIFEEFHPFSTLPDDVVEVERIREIDDMRIQLLTNVASGAGKVWLYDLLATASELNALAHWVKIAGAKPTYRVKDAA